MSIILDVTMSKIKQLFRYVASLEAEMDDLIEQMFYEVNNPREELPVDTYIDPVEEVTGLRVSSANDLINNIDDMWPYYNKSGRSNVRAYKYGTEWFLVEFADESYYLYTLKSLPAYQLEEMKYLANNGIGLNSFISKHVKINYAAKRIINEITIRPGMESHDSLTKPSGKYLWLIKAYMNGCDTERRFKMSNERVTLESYQSQINAAGPDGLTLQARRLMQIGLHQIDGSIGFESIAVENFNDVVNGADIQSRIDHVEMSVSNEGIGDKIIAGFKNLFRGGKPEILNKTAVTVGQLIKETYLNQEWLDKRDFVKGKITVSTDRSGAALNGNINGKLKAAIGEIKRSRPVNAKTIKEAIDYVKPVIRFLDGGGWKDAEKTADVFTSFNEDKEHAYYEFKHVDYREDWHGEALTKEQVVNLAKQVLELIEEYGVSYFDADWYRFSTNNGERRYSEKSKEYQSVNKYYDGNIPTEVRTALEEVSTYLYAVQNSYYQHYQFKNAGDLIRATVSMIDASVE